jgi:hypothetical protein
LGTAGARGAFAGDLSLTILFLGSERLCSSSDAPNTKGIGDSVSLVFMPAAKSKEGGVFENRELESPRSLTVGT